MFGLDVAAEFIAHRGEQLVCKHRFATRTKSRIERRRQHIDRYTLLDRRHNCPASFTGIIDIAGETREFRIVGQSGRREVKQPRTNYAAATPKFCYLRKIKPVLLLLPRCAGRMP